MSLQRIHAPLLAVILLISPSIAAGESHDGSKAPAEAIKAAANEHDLSADLLYAVALQEARRFDGRVVRPHPWATRDDRAGPQYFDSRDEAEAYLEEFLTDHPEDPIDIGMFQIAYHWHGHHVAHPADLLVPEKSAEVAALLLSRAKRSAEDSVLGVGRYHSWSEGRARQYGQQVLGIYERIRQQGGVLNDE